MCSHVVSIVSVLLEFGQAEDAADGIEITSAADLALATLDEAGRP